MDELLESPQFGEHWARHWMDIVHYSDTHGYGLGTIRPMRPGGIGNYLIREFNADVPYNRLIERAPGRRSAGRSACRARGHR